MRKRLLAVIMSAVCCLGVAFSGCANPGNTGNGGNEQYAEYQLYLTYAAEHNETPLTYEEWLASIKGEKGDPGAVGPQGPEGPQGETGPAGRGIASMVIDDEGHLIVTYTDSNLPVDLGKVVGEKGQTGQTGATGSTGQPGAAGRGISSMTIDDNGHLIVVYTDSVTPVDLGKVVGDSTGTSATPVNQWWTGTADPDSASGNDGDFYIDTDDFLLYKKEGGEWIVILQKFGGKDTTQYYKNFFNINDSDVINGKWINDGVVANYSTSLTVTGFIPVENGKSYIYNTDSKFVSESPSGYTKVYFFDENKTYLGNDTRVWATTLDNNGTDAKGDDKLKFTVNNANAKYVRLTVGANYASTFMFVEGSTMDDWPYTYVAYGDRLAIPGTGDTSDNGADQSNPLFMKKILWEGDSICEGAGCAGGYATMVATANSMSSDNKGVSGGTITSGVANVSHYIVDGISSLAGGNYDYIIAEGGINDCSRGVAIGDESAYEATNFSTEYINGLDKTTFRGAFELMCVKLALSGKKVGYIFVHKIYDASVANWAKDYRPVALELLQKWGIPYLDLETLVPPIGVNPTLSALYTNNNDKYHPNELGYKTYYVDKITAWLKTL